MSGGFVKIYGSKLLKSTLWLESIEARLLFIGMLAEADADGVVDIPSVKALAHRMNMTVEQTESGLAVLESPDPESRTEAMEGRRVVRDGRVWRVVNYDKYRELRTERQEAERLRKAKERADESGQQADGADKRGRVQDKPDASERGRKSADMSASRPQESGHGRKSADANADKADTALEADAEREEEEKRSPQPPKGGGTGPVELRDASQGGFRPASSGGAFWSEVHGAFSETWTASGRTLPFIAPTLADGCVDFVRRVAKANGKTVREAALAIAVAALKAPGGDPVWHLSRLDPFAPPRPLPGAANGLPGAERQETPDETRARLKRQVEEANIKARGGRGAA